MIAGMIGYMFLVGLVIAVLSMLEDAFADYKANERRLEAEAAEEKRRAEFEERLSRIGTWPPGTEKPKSTTTRAELLAHIKDDY